MTSPRRRTLPLLLSAPILMALLTTAGPAHAQSPKRAQASANAATVNSKVGTYCVSSKPNGDGVSTGGGVCADAVPPKRPPRERLNVAPGNRVLIDFRRDPELLDKVEAIDVALARATPGGYRRVGQAVNRVRHLGGNRWRVVLPRRLGRANVLDVFARLESGDANHLIGLRTMRRKTLADCPMNFYTPVRAKPLRGLTPRAARRLAHRNGCELRVLRRDGRELPHTDDLGTGRLNVSVRDGVVAALIGVF